MDIWLHTNIAAHSFIAPEYWKRNYAAVKQAVEQAETYVCAHGGRVCGFIGLTGNYIAGLFVEGRMQGRGFGSALLSYVQELKPSLSLSVYAQNRRAVSFYQRHGFQIDASQTDADTGCHEYRMSWQHKGQPKPLA